MELQHPFTKPRHKEAGVPTLYELCVRFVHSQLRIQNEGNNNHCIRDTVNSWKLPETIKNDLRSGPTAYCQACKCALFQSMIIRIFDANFEVVSEFVESCNTYSVDHRTKIILCCCSPYCSNQNVSSTFIGVSDGLFSFCENFTELDWTTCWRPWVIEDCWNLITVAFFVVFAVCISFSSLSDEGMCLESYPELQATSSIWKNYSTNRIPTPYWTFPRCDIFCGDLLYYFFSHEIRILIIFYIPVLEIFFHTRTVESPGPRIRRWSTRLWQRNVVDENYSSERQWIFFQAKI